MEKRSRIKKESNESIALKKLRNFSGLSQRKEAERIGVTQSLIYSNTIFLTSSLNFR